MRHSVVEEASSQSNFYFPCISAPSQAYTSNGIPHLLKKNLASRFVQFGEWLSTGNELSFVIFFSSSREFLKIIENYYLLVFGVLHLAPAPNPFPLPLKKKGGLTSK